MASFITPSPKNPSIVHVAESKHSISEKYPKMVGYIFKENLVTKGVDQLYW